MTLRPLIVSLDLETTTTPYMKRKASPFTTDNWVVAAAYKVHNKDRVMGSYFGEDRQGVKGWLKHILQAYNPKLLAGFNIKFDLLHLLYSSPEDYQEYMRWVADGGLVWDGQLAEYLLLGQVQEAHMLSLDEVAPRYGGDLKIDEVKALWEQGVNTHEIPRQLLMDYLVGRGEAQDGGDIKNTEAIVLGQLKAATKAKQTKSILLNMGALVASIEMEKNGLHVDKALGLELAAKLQTRIDELEVKLNEYIPKDLPFEFNWGSRKQLSALIFGGEVTYQARAMILDEAGNQTYVQKDEDHALLNTPAADGSTMTVPLEQVLADIAAGKEWNVQRFAGGKRAGEIKTRKVKVNDLSKPKSRIEDFVHRLKGFTKPRKEWEGAEPGVYSTSGDVIEELGATTDIPFLLDLAERSKHVKDLGTYYLTTDPKTGEEKGMLRLVQAHDSIVHHSINHTSTVTGRLSHSNPNSGNLPREGTSEVKRMFTSRFQDGKIASSDFTSLEVYCQANLSHDKQLVADLVAGLDMHVMRLSTVENRPYEELLPLAKGYKDGKGNKVDAKPEWARKRTDIKTYSFQRAYGAGAPKIAAFVKRPVEEVQLWMEKDDERYPGIPKFNAKVETIVKQSRYPTARYIQHPTAKTPLQLGRGELRTFDGKLYVFQESPSPDFMVKRGQLQGFSPTELKNYPVQGLGGEVMKAAMYLMVRTLYFYRNFDGNVLLINTVHDALYADAANGYERKAGVILHAAMLGANDLLEYQFNHRLDVPVPAETHWGHDMFKEEQYPDYKQFEVQANGLRKWMRRQFMEGFVPSYLQE